MISLEGWVDIMYYIQDTHTFYDWVYFVLLIVVSNQLQPLLHWLQPITALGCLLNFSFIYVLILVFLLPFPFLAGDQPCGLGQYNVLCSRHPFILGLDVLCIADCGEYMLVASAGRISPLLPHSVAGMNHDLDPM